MSHPMGPSAPLAIGDRVDESGPASAPGSARVPMSTADGPSAGDVVSLVRSVLNEPLLECQGRCSNAGYRRS
jgi:hypothetical protein